LVLSAVESRTIDGSPRAIARNDVSGAKRLKLIIGPADPPFRPLHGRCLGRSLENMVADNRSPVAYTSRHRVDWGARRRGTRAPQPTTYFFRPAPLRVGSVRT
jgi:hypothetical protein